MHTNSFKRIITACFIAVFFAAPAITSAQTTDDLRSEIDKLLTQVSMLQIQIKILEKKAALEDSFFSKDLKQGDTGDDVRKLQEVLNYDRVTRVAHRGLGSPGNETDFFGELTKKAVIRFQEFYASEILTPHNLVFGTGFVGSSTRKKLNEITGAKKGAVVVEDVSPETEQSVVLKPKITSISPVKGVNGTIVTITGEEFTVIGNKIKTTLFTLGNMSSFDGKKISFKLYSDVVDDLLGDNIAQQEGFTVEEILAESAEDPEIPLEAIPPSDMSFLFPFFISVANKNGESNTVRFELDMDPRSQAKMTSIDTSIVSRVKEFFARIVPVDLSIKTAEASKSWRRYFNSSQNSANSQFSGLGGGTGGISIGPAFGGLILFTIPCLCSGSVAFTTIPVGGSPGPYNVSLWSTSIKANYFIKPGSWVLGSSLPAGVCSIYAGVWCFPYAAQEIPPIPGVGVSL